MVRLWRVLHPGAWLSFDSLCAEFLESRPAGEYAANLEVVSGRGQESPGC